MGYADLEARLGAVALKRIANATVSLNAQPAVRCVYSNEAEVAALGEHGYQVRGVAVQLLIADAGAAAQGTSAVVSFRGTATQWQVRERLPDDVHLGQATLLLEQVPA